MILKIFLNLILLLNFNFFQASNFKKSVSDKQNKNVNDYAEVDNQITEAIAKSDITKGVECFLRFEKLLKADVASLNKILSKPETKFNLNIIDKKNTDEEKNKIIEQTMTVIGELHESQIKLLSNFIKAEKYYKKIKFEVFHSLWMAVNSYRCSLKHFSVGLLTSVSQEQLKIFNNAFSEIYVPKLESQHKILKDIYDIFFNFNNEIYLQFVSFYMVVSKTKFTVNELQELFKKFNVILNLMIFEIEIFDEMLSQNS